MSDAVRRAWAVRLKRVARPVTRTAGPRLPGGAGLPFALAVTHQTGRAPERLSPDDASLWWALVDPGALSHVEELVDMEADGPLMAVDRYLAIEVWTESELCGLHALINLAVRHRRDAWMQRALRACAWHMRETQPDHATARPWAIHGFILLHTPESEHFAEMLLHTARALAGTPDVNSAWVLLDAAEHLCMDTDNR